MDELWARVPALMSATLYAGTSRVPFTIVAAQDHLVAVRSGNGDYQEIPRASIEGAARLGLSGRSLTHRALRESGFAPQHVGYIIGILRGLSYLANLDN